MDDSDAIAFDNATSDDRRSTEAGVVRGLARSVQSMGRHMVKLPSVGRLPAPARISVPQVAKLSDRISTGWGVWDSAKNEIGAWKLSRLKNFAISLIKNTALGLAVFQTYSYTIVRFAPSLQQGDCTGDEYARTSIPLHFVGGALGGSVHGIAGSVWEILARQRALQSIPKDTLHHSSAHAALFGSYETLKRLFLQTAGLDSKSYQAPGYVASVSVAGGLAGQVQHILSHYTEQWLRLEEVESSLSVNVVRRPPVLRHVMMAFPPSAVAFVAFEYGRRYQ